MHITTPMSAKLAALVLVAGAALLADGPDPDLSRTGKRWRRVHGQDDRSADLVDQQGVGIDFLVDRLTIDFEQVVTISNIHTGASVSTLFT